MGPPGVPGLSGSDTGTLFWCPGGGSAAAGAPKFCPNIEFLQSGDPRGPKTRPPEHGIKSERLIREVEYLFFLTHSLPRQPRA